MEDGTMFNLLKTITVIKKADTKQVVRNQRCQCRTTHKRKDC